MTTIPKLTIYKSLIAGFLVVFVGVSAQLISTSTTDPSNIESSFGLDTLFKLRGSTKAPPEAVIVAIDKVASSHYGFENEPLAWSRDYHARIINKLSQAGANTIVFDIFFKRPRKSQNDIKMATAIRNSGNVILFAKLKRQLLNASGKTPQTLNQENILSIETVQAPLALFSESALTVAPFTLAKFPAKITRFWTFRTTAGDVPTLPIVALHHYLNPKLLESLENIHIPKEQSLSSTIAKFRELLQSKAAPYLRRNAENNIPVQNLLSAYAGTPQPYLNFYGPPRSIQTFTYDQVLEDRLPENFSFKNKVVFVGFSEKLEPEQKDNFNTVFSQPSGLDLSGIEIAATAFLNLLHNRTIKPISNDNALLIIIGFGFIIAFVSRVFREYIALLSCIGLSAAYLYFVLYQFSVHAIWLPLFVPLIIQAPFALILGLSWYALDNYCARKKMRHAFSYYVPETMVDFLTEQKQSIQHSQELQYGVCMATDAEQYTQLSETLTPKNLAELMNEYYETLFSSVRNNNGTVSDIIGDAMLALWLHKDINSKHNKPTDSNINLCIQACLASIDIINSHNKKYNVKGKKIILPTRIGLHAGEMMVGNVGAVNHYEYRAVGDVVNTTTRIESLNKHFNTYLLASEEVLNKTNQFVARNIGNFVLAGKTHPITLHEIIQTKHNVSKQTQQKVDRFHQALSLYQQGLLKEAEKTLLVICKEIPTDGVARFYLQQCQQQRTMQNYKNWDGTIKFSQK